MRALNVLRPLTKGTFLTAKFVFCLVVGVVVVTAIQLVKNTCSQTC